MMAELNNKKLLFPFILIVSFSVLVFAAFVFDRPEAPDIASIGDQSSESSQNTQETSETPDSQSDSAESSENHEAHESSDTTDSTASGGYEASPDHGLELINQRGCIGCHSIDGSGRVGPTFQGLYGHEHTFADGSTGVADDAYIIESIRDPNAKIVEGFQSNLMPVFNESSLSEEDVLDIIAYLKTLSE